MPFYKYVAKSETGSTVTEIIEANSRDVAIDIVRAKKLIVITISEQSQKKKSSMFASKKVKAEELVIFSRQMATMVNAGIPLVQSLDILSEQIDNPYFKQVIINVRTDVESGLSLSAGLEKHQKIFSLLYVNMVKAGELGGMLDEILERLATYLEKNDILIHKVKSAMIYPAVVSSMAVLITLALLLKVVPIFKGIFDTLGGKLPLPTQILIQISDVMQHYFIFVAVVIGILLVVIKKLIATDTGRLKFDDIKLKLPIFGILLKKLAVARFSRTLSTLIKSGVPILGALEIVGKTAGNRVVELAVDQARGGIREGESIASPLAKSKVFPPMVTRMISVGEESGELEKMLSKIADFYEVQVDTAVSGLTSLIEPLIIAFLGIVVGSIVLAMFLPIFKISQLV